MQDMRVSLRKAVKIAAFCVTFLVLNAFVGLRLSIFSESASGKFGKVLGHLRHDNGDPGQVVVAPSVPLPPSHGDGLERQQRDVQSVAAGDHDGPEVSRSGKEIRGTQAVKPATKSPATPPSQQLSHDRPTELSDIFISVKTSGKFHNTRLQLLVRTWFILARDQTYFFSDENDQKVSDVTGGHLINTNCSSSHTRQSLCCKMSVEFDAYLASKKRWMCHFDDDTYVNIPLLVELLRSYKHTEDWYLGKPSLRHPLEIPDPDNSGMKVVFWFATGSGFCISRGLALKMMPHAGGGRLMAIGIKLRLPDDCVIGYIVEHLLKKQLTVIEEFRSHLEALGLIKTNQLKKQITLSYSKYGERQNIVNVPGFSVEEDPTRFKSIHCHLFPTFRECKALQT